MKRGRHYIYLFVLILLIYSVWILTRPADPELLQRHDLSLAKARLLILTIAIPVVAIWSIMFYGFYKTARYAHTVRKSPEGSGLRRLSQGLMVLAYGMPLNSILSRLFEYLGESYPTWSSAATIIDNYSSLLLVLIVFVLVGKGAENLANLIRKKITLREMKFWTISFIVLSGIYSYFVVSSSATSDNYLLPNWVVLFTIGIPYLYVWFRGMLAAYHINHYRRHVKGRIYKHALGYFSVGIASVIGTSILMQLLVSAAPNFEQLNLTPLLMIIYVLLVVLSFGFILIAVGAKKLQKIEEV